MECAREDKTVGSITMNTIIVHVIKNLYCLTGVMNKS